MRQSLNPLYRAADAGVPVIASRRGTWALQAQINKTDRNDARHGADDAGGLTSGA